MSNPTMVASPALPEVHNADEFWRLPNDEYRYELVRGELRRSMGAGFRHGVLAARIGQSLMSAVTHGDLGVVCAAETGFRLADDHVRCPDAAFVSQARVDDAGAVEAFFPGAPDVAIEVVSPSDRYTEVEEKAFDWLDAGTRMVVIVNERRQSVTVVRSATEVSVLSGDDVLDGGDVVPGWTLRVADVFV